MYAVVVVLFVTLFAGPLSAQTPLCGDAAHIAKQLKDRYGESPIGVGVHSSGDLIQMYVSEETGTWTIVSTTPRGRSCIMAAGKGWEVAPEGDAVAFKS